MAAIWISFVASSHSNFQGYVTSYSGLVKTTIDDFIFVLLVVIHCSFLLLLVQRRSEELASASGEQLEAVSNLGNKVILGSKGNSTVAHQLSTANNSNIVYTDEFDTSVAILNVVCFLYVF